MQKFRVTVRMKKAWTTESDYPKKPSINDVLEEFGNAILDRAIDDEIFEITVEEIKKRKRLNLIAVGSQEAS